MKHGPSPSGRLHDMSLNAPPRLPAQLLNISCDRSCDATLAFFIPPSPLRYVLTAVLQRRYFHIQHSRPLSLCLTELSKTINHDALRPLSRCGRGLPAGFAGGLRHLDLAGLDWFEVHQHCAHYHYHRYDYNRHGLQRF